MKIYYSKKNTKNDVTIEIKVEDEVNYEIETPDESIERLKNFVNRNLEDQPI